MFKHKKIFIRLSSPDFAKQNSRSPNSKAVRLCFHSALLSDAKPLFYKQNGRQPNCQILQSKTSFHLAKLSDSRQAKVVKSYSHNPRQKKIVSGELFKEPLMDVFLTNLEQTAYSLKVSKKGGNLELDATVLRSRTTANDFDLPLLNDPRQAKLLRGYSHNPTPNKQSFSSFCKQNNEVPVAIPFRVKIANYVSCGEKIGNIFGKSATVGKSGKIIKISKNQIALQKTQILLFYSEAKVHVKQGDWVKRGAPILTLTNNTLITGDIVQGIPRIEQLFEAPNAPPLALRTGEYVYTSLHSQIREIFRKNWLLAPLPVAVRNTLQEMQQILIESIQKVYLSQGVLIADKHVEIVVAQMTTKAQIIDSGSTGLFLEEVLSVREIENANIATPGKKALYAPTIIGLTKSALHSDSFLSAASFQETSRVLSRDAIIGKSDFLRGLKEKVVIGDIISAGTGLDEYIVYTLLCNKQFSHLLTYPASCSLGHLAKLIG